MTKECAYCEIAEGHTDALIVYEDQVSMVIFAPKPAAFGHLQVIPKKDIETLDDIPDEIVTHLFFVANKASAVLFEALGIEGTNIIVSDGKDANQKFPHFFIEVIPRKQDDGLDFRWQPKQLSQDEFAEVAGRIKDKADYIKLGKEEKKEVKEETKEEAEEVKEPEDIEDVKERLTRIP